MCVRLCARPHLWQHPPGLRLLELPLEVRRPQVALTALGLLLPLRFALLLAAVVPPVVVGRALFLRVPQKRGLVHVGDREDLGDPHPLIGRQHREPSAGPVQDVGVAGAVHAHAREQGLPSRDVLHQNPSELLVLHDGLDHHRGEEAAHAVPRREGVRDALEGLARQVQPVVVAFGEGWWRGARVRAQRASAPRDRQKGRAFFGWRSTHGKVEVALMDLARSSSSLTRPSLFTASLYCHQDTLSMPTLEIVPPRYSSFSTMRTLREGFALFAATAAARPAHPPPPPGRPPSPPPGLSWRARSPSHGWWRPSCGLKSEPFSLCPCSLGSRSSGTCPRPPRGSAARSSGLSTEIGITLARVQTNSQSQSWQGSSPVAVEVVAVEVDRGRMGVGVGGEENQKKKRWQLVSLLPLCMHWPASDVVLPTMSLQTLFES